MTIEQLRIDYKNLIDSLDYFANERLARAIPIMLDVMEIVTTLDHYDDIGIAVEQLFMVIDAFTSPSN